MIRKILRIVFRWVFTQEIKEFEAATNKARKQAQQLESFLGNIDVSVDVHEYQYSSSWAVISIQGSTTDYLKFVDLGKAEIEAISRFLRSFERQANIKIDASPLASGFLRINNRRNTIDNSLKVS
jgi:hypothetical protein